MPAEYRNFEHRIKCVRCSLHYIVLSEDESWPESHALGACPECGSRGGKLVWGPVEMTDENGGRFIFQRVPGDAGMSNIDLATARSDA